MGSLTVVIIAIHHTGQYVFHIFTKIDIIHLEVTLLGKDTRNFIALKNRRSAWHLACP